MLVIDSRTFTTADHEAATFSVGQTSQVSGVTGSVDAGPGAPLPLTITGHHQVDINVAFMGDSGGFADIDISGSEGGGTTNRIAQIPGVPFRDRVYAT